MEQMMRVIGAIQELAEAGSAQCKAAIICFEMLQPVVAGDTDFGIACRNLLKATANPDDLAYRQMSPAERSLASSTAAALLKTIEDMRHGT